METKDYLTLLLSSLALLVSFLAYRNSRKTTILAAAQHKHETILEAAERRNDVITEFLGVGILISEARSYSERLYSRVTRNQSATETEGEGLTLRISARMGCGTSRTR